MAVEPKRLPSFGAVAFAQRDGQGPELMFDAAPMGEHGVGLYQVRFEGGAQVASDCAASHWLFLHLAAPARMSCRIESHALEHVATSGSVVLCPAGSRSTAVAATAVQGLLMFVPNAPLALLMAEHGRPRVQLAAKLAGIDPELSELARDLCTAARSGDPGRSELDAALYEHLFARFASSESLRQRGVLSATALERIHCYVSEHLGDAIAVDALADIAKQPRSNFPRVFRRALGLSPYQYIVRVRSQHALRAIREGKQPLAVIASQTGFVDQAHLTHWMKRMYGSSPGLLRNLQKSTRLRAC